MVSRIQPTTFRGQIPLTAARSQVRFGTQTDSSLPGGRQPTQPRHSRLRQATVLGTGALALILASFKAGSWYEQRQQPPGPTMNGVAESIPMQDRVKTAEDVPAYYPPIKPFRTQMLKVSPIHTIYVEESGNPNGFPVFYLHGGPAAGLGDDYQDFFDPKFFHIIGFDQRGAGRSTPLGELKDNTTWALVEDIQKIREALGIKNKKYLLFGGSWGSLLALAAAETHPEDVAGLIIRGVSLGRPADTAWSTRTGDGLFHLYPEASDYWDKIVANAKPTPEEIKFQRDPALGVFDRLFNDPDVPEDVRLNAVKYWRLGNTYIPGERLAQREQTKPLPDYAENIHTARIVCRYYYHNAFMDPPDQLIRNVHRLKDIPLIRIVNGREDIQTPPKRAYDLYRAMQRAGIKHAQLKITEGAGHSAGAPPTLRFLMQALDDFKAMHTPQNGVAQNQPDSR